MFPQFGDRTIYTICKRLVFAFQLTIVNRVLRGLCRFPLFWA